jgi:hypothetical protein
MRWFSSVEGSRKSLMFSGISDQITRIIKAPILIRAEKSRKVSPPALSAA